MITTSEYPSHINAIRLREKIFFAYFTHLIMEVRIAGRRAPNRYSIGRKHFTLSISLKLTHLFHSKVTHPLHGCNGFNIA